MKHVDSTSPLPRIGWREYVHLPALDIRWVKAKVDTGARTSALHAFDIHYHVRHGATWVRFSVHPRQRNAKRVVHCEAPLVEERFVTDSGGRRTLRPVVVTAMELLGQTIDVELTLIARDSMGFRMLIGRQAIRGRFVVDASCSFVGGRRRKSKKRRAARAAKNVKSTKTGFHP